MYFNTPYTSWLDYMTSDRKTYLAPSVPTYFLCDPKIQINLYLTYRPVFVMTISVPNWWKSFQSWKFSSSTTGESGPSSSWGSSFFSSPSVLLVGVVALVVTGVGLLEAVTVVGVEAVVVGAVLAFKAFPVFKIYLSLKISLNLRISNQQILINLCGIF